MTPDSPVVARRSSDWLTVEVLGPDAVSFVHRLSTADVENMQPGERRLSAFVDKRGRMRALTWVVARPDGLELFGPGAAGDLVEWLDAFHFSEDLTLGAPADRQQALELVGVADAPSLDSKPGCSAHRWLDVGADGDVPWTVVSGPSKQLADLLEEGIARGWKEDQGEIDRWRIEAGVPGPAEINDQHNPLELALHDAISWDKGCYIGQEVIARIDNYDKQSRHLVGLRLDEGGPLAGGMDLLDEAEAKVGRVTSAVAGTGVVGLGLVRGREPIGLKLTVSAEDARYGVTTVARAAAQTPHD